MESRIERKTGTSSTGPFETAVILLMLLPIFAIPHISTTSPPFQAPVPGPYEQRLDVALGMLGAQT